MPIEIEHKYLVVEDKWISVKPAKSMHIRQGYLQSEANHTVRIRTTGNQGYITVKGLTTGSSRPEFEYEIPYQDAIEMLNLFCISVIEKTRHYVSVSGNTWEVDVFEGNNTGLIIAEIELLSEEQYYVLPPWVGLNVSDDFRYANVNLAANPFSTWPCI